MVNKVLMAVTITFPQRIRHNIEACLIVFAFHFWPSLKHPNNIFTFIGCHSWMVLMNNLINNKWLKNSSSLEHGVAVFEWRGNLLCDLFPVWSSPSPPSVYFSFSCVIRLFLTTKPCLRNPWVLIKVLEWQNFSVSIKLRFKITDKWQTRFSLAQNM